MKFILIIPARYQSSRFPGKPLARLGNKPIIQHVYESACQAIEQVWVATDDQRIFDCVTNFGGNALMTGSDLQSGTDRCAQAARKISEQTPFDVVINIQGDEPFIHPSQIELLKSCFSNSSDEIATLIKKIEDPEILFNPNRPKVVIDSRQQAIFFSRSPIPYVRGTAADKWLDVHTFYHHIGLYAYRKDILSRITRLTVSPLEKAESLEQLRWLENGYRIRTATTNSESMGIDTPEDLEKAHQFLQHVQDNNQ